jgi:preprotein translocase subunit SecD
MVLLTYERGNGCGTAETRNVDLEQVAQIINKRLNGEGTAKVLKDGRMQVEIRGEHDKASLDSIKNRIAPMGCMEFRILADASFPKDKAIIELAKLLPPEKTEVLQGEKKVAEWIVFNPREFGANDVSHGGMVTRSTGKSPEALLLIDDENVSGEFLKSVSKANDGGGHAAIQFSLNEEGAKRFQKLTSSNLPDGANPSLVRHLGVVLNNRLMTAPALRSTISENGMISGSSMTDEEISTTVENLNRGSLPSAIHLVSEEAISN